MKRPLYFLLVLLFSWSWVFGQPEYKEISLKGSAIVHSFLPLADSSYLLTNGLARIGKLDANFNLVFNKEFQGKSTQVIAFSNIAESNNHFSVVGAIQELGAPVLTDFSFVSFFNPCYEIVWSKALVFLDTFRDTSILNKSVQIIKTAFDDDFNIYLVTIGEKKFGKFGKGCSQIYKFDKFGKLLWRKPIAQNWGNNFFLISFSIKNQTIYYSAMSYFQHIPTNPNLLSIRSVVGILDTSGKYLNERIFVQDSALLNLPGALGFSSNPNWILVNISGKKYPNQTDIVNEEHLMVLDSTLGTKLDWVSTSRDSFFYWNSINTVTDDSTVWAISFRQNPKEGKDKFDRRNTACLFKFNSSLEVLDSFELDFLHLTNVDDTTADFFHFSQHPIIDSAFVLVIKKVNSMFDQKILGFTMSKTGKLLNPTFSLANYNPGCDSLVKSGNLELNFGKNDTLYLPFYYDWNYKDTFLTILDDPLVSPIKVEVFPNPVSDEFKILPAEGIVSLSLVDYLGRSHLLPLPDSSGSVLVNGFESGIYILKISYRNNQVGFVKLQIQ
ncbi:MAG: T9SS type A sorting domain-containing protein [Bacteroidia bacterium]|nr:T9SS type A sorting domain-containing protein [Bacteroidia bacterium]